MINLFDKNKKGTIILSHYRSGGTQLKEVISNVLEADNLGEIDFDLNNTNYFQSNPSATFGNELISIPLIT